MSSSAPLCLVISLAPRQAKLSTSSIVYSSVHQGTFNPAVITNKEVHENINTNDKTSLTTCNWGGEWHLEKRGSRRILAGSRNLESIFDKSRSIVFAWFVFTFSSLKLFTKESRSRIFNQDLGVSVGLGFYHSLPLIMQRRDFLKSLITFPNKMENLLYLVSKLCIIFATFF